MTGMIISKYCIGLSKHVENTTRRVDLDILLLVVVISHNIKNPLENIEVVDFYISKINMT